MVDRMVEGPFGWTPSWVLVLFGVRSLPIKKVYCNKCRRLVRGQDFHQQDKDSQERAHAVSECNLVAQHIRADATILFSVTIIMSQFAGLIEQRQSNKMRWLRHSSGVNLSESSLIVLPAGLQCLRGNTTAGLRLQWPEISPFLPESAVQPNSMDITAAAFPGSAFYVG